MPRISSRLSDEEAFRVFSEQGWDKDEEVILEPHVDGNRNDLYRLLQYRGRTEDVRSGAKGRGNK